VTVGLSGVARAGTGAVCGNGTAEPPEVCDDGNTTSGDGCSGVSCLPEVCGDTIVNPDPAPGPAETCDDGNTAANDGCSATCQLECGNGTLEGAEVCDTSGESATCDDDCTAPLCGDDNENAAAGEGCDDGNVTPGDGCDASCQPETVAQTKGQQGCINGINANFLGVAKAQDKNLSSCLKAVASGKAALGDCLGVDPKGKVAAAKAKTSKTDLKKCVAPNVPTFAYTGDDVTNAAGDAAPLTSALIVFGNPPNVATTAADKAGAGCQAEVMKRSAKLIETWISEANKAKKTALKGSKTTAAVPNAVALATAVDTAIGASAAITKGENGVNSGLAKKCADADVPNIADLFDCGGAATSNALALCVIAGAKDEACKAFEIADDLALDCPSDMLP
jgi:cysteine-rich repeat protein